MKWYYLFRHAVKPLRAINGGWVVERYYTQPSRIMCEMGQWSRMWWCPIANLIFGCCGAQNFPPHPVLVADLSPIDTASQRQLDRQSASPADERWLGVNMKSSSSTSVYHFA
eukprot:6490567-Amphidinium_carterae.1